MVDVEKDNQLRISMFFMKHNGVVNDLLTFSMYNKESDSVGACVWRN